MTRTAPPGANIPRDGRRGVASTLARRASWSAIDQVLSSLSNFLLSVLVARKVNADGYGAFAISFSLYAYTIAVSRPLVSQPLTIRYSGARGDDFRAAARQSTGAALVVAGLVAVPLLAAGLIARGPLGASLTTTAILLPGLLLQDSYRMVFFANGRPAAAAANDALWGIAQVAAVLLVYKVQATSPVAYLWAWGLSGCLAAVFAAVQARLWPMPLEAWHWVRTHTNLTRYSVTEFVAINGANQLTLALMAAIGGLSVVGALRGAQVLTAPMTMLSLSTMAFIVPELARRPSIMGQRLVRTALAISVVSTTLTALWGAMLVLLPASLGELLLGATWAGSGPIIWPTVIGMMAGMASLGAACGVYARDRMRVLFPFVVAGAPVYLVAGVAGVLMGGVSGAAVGLAVAAAYGSVVGWVRLVLISREPS